MATVIPAINCVHFECVQDKVRAAKEFLPKDGWLHIDVADGSFTFNKTWGNKSDDPTHLADALNGLPLEVHLMVEEPEKVVESWLKAGAKRIIVHLEALRELPAVPDARRIKGGEAVDEFIVKKCKKYHAEAMLAINPETPANTLLPYEKKFSGFQILAVTPGLASQKFFPIVLDKIKFLKSKLPDVTIEVDGGVNFDTGKLAKDAGASLLVSASYIFDSPNPEEAYEKLQGL